jgi:hypothetical protein
MTLATRRLPSGPLAVLAGVLLAACGVPDGDGTADALGDGAFVPAIDVPSGTPDPAYSDPGPDVASLSCPYSAPYNEPCAGEGRRCSGTLYCPGTWDEPWSCTCANGRWSCDGLTCMSPVPDNGPPDYGPCSDACDPEQPDRCEDDEWTHCNYADGCYHLHTGTCGAFSSCDGNYCNLDPIGPGDLGQPCTDDAQCRARCTAEDVPDCWDRQCGRPSPDLPGICTTQCEFCKGDAPFCVWEPQLHCPGTHWSGNPQCAVRFPVTDPYYAGATWIGCAVSCAGNGTKGCPAGLDCRAWPVQTGGEPATVDVCVPPEWPLP